MEYGNTEHKFWQRENKTPTSYCLRFMKYMIFCRRYNNRARLWILFAQNRVMRRRERKRWHAATNIRTSFVGWAQHKCPNWLSYTLAEQVKIEAWLPPQTMTLFESHSDSNSSAYPFPYRYYFSFSFAYRRMPSNRRKRFWKDLPWTSFRDWRHKRLNIRFVDIVCPEREGPSSIYRLLCPHPIGIVSYRRYFQLKWNAVCNWR